MDIGTSGPVYPLQSSLRGLLHRTRVNNSLTALHLFGELLHSDAILWKICDTNNLCVLALLIMISIIPRRTIQVGHITGQLRSHKYIPSCFELKKLAGNENFLLDTEGAYGRHPNDGYCVSLMVVIVADDLLMILY